MTRPRDANGETYLDHLANAVQPLTFVTSAPEMFTAEDVRAFIDGAMARLERARALLTTTEEGA